MKKEDLCEKCLEQKKYRDIFFKNTRKVYAIGLFWSITYY